MQSTVGRHRWRLWACTVAIGFVAASAAGELAVRLVEPRADSPGMALRGSTRLYGYAPNSKGYAGGVAFSINSDGFRGPEFGEIDGTTEIVVLVLGDSYAFGYGVDADQAFPSVLGARLKEEYPLRPVRVLNLGIPGYDTSQELAVLQELGPKLHPRMVLLQYHLNDIQRHEGSIDSARQSPRRMFDGTLTQLENHLHLLRLVLPWLAAAARAVNWHVRTTSSAELDEYANNGAAWQQNQETLKRLFGTAHAMGAAIGVLIVPYLVQLDDRHLPAPAYQVVLRFCASNGIPVVNAFDYFKGQSAGKLWISPFNGHPNATGHVLMAAAADLLVKQTGLLEAQ